MWWGVEIKYPLFLALIFCRARRSVGEVKELEDGIPRSIV